MRRRSGSSARAISCSSPARPPRRSTTSTPIATRRHVHPHSIEQQTRNAMEAIKSILDDVGATWKDVVKVTKYLTDIRDFDGMHRAMNVYFGDWRPASTTLCVN